MDWDTIGLYLGVILTFCTLSFLYKENWFSGLRSISLSSWRPPIRSSTTGTTM